MKDILEAILIFSSIIIGLAVLVFVSPWIIEAAGYNAKIAECYFADYQCK